MDTPPAVADAWERGDPYERYIGRWSRAVAPLFLDWLAAPSGARWVDVGCGTGALSSAIADRCAPASLDGVEPSDGFRALAASRLGDRAALHAGNGASLPLPDHGRDLVVSGLVLNFIPDLPAALREMQRVAVPGGTVAAYVWDYGGRMDVIRAFWDEAAALDPAAVPLHEAARFPQCRPEALSAAFASAGLSGVATAPLPLDAVFDGFDDYWSPFLGGQGPAPSYVASLDDARRTALREALRRRLPAGADGRLVLGAHAWAVRGTVPG